MNFSLTADECGLIATDRPEGVLSFLVSRSKSSARSLTPTVHDVLKGCAMEVGAIVRATSQTRTGAEYQVEFQRSFPKYVALVIAMSHVASAVVPQDTIERLTRETICEMEADFRDKGLAAFGASVRSQALFTVWTLRKTSEVINQIVAAKLDPFKKKDDLDCCAHFHVYALRAQFSLDCLNMALHSEQSIYPEVLEELTDGLRGMVNAYAWARQGLEARVPMVEQDLAIQPMDDEDRDFLDAAFQNASEFDV